MDRARLFDDVAISYRPSPARRYLEPYLGVKLQAAVAVPPGKDMPLCKVRRSDARAAPACRPRQQWLTNSK